jgi:hypothetical protein
MSTVKTRRATSQSSLVSSEAKYSRTLRVLLMIGLSIMAFGLFWYVVIVRHYLI